MIVQKLALSPLSLQKIESTTGGDSKDINRILSLIATKKSPGYYYLKQEAYKEVQLNWSDYSTTDKEKVRDQMKQSFNSLKIPTEEQERLLSETSKPVNKNLSNGIGPIKIKTEPIETVVDNNLVKTATIVKKEPVPKVGRQIVNNHHNNESIVVKRENGLISYHRAPIVSHQQYIEYKDEYEKKYAVYKQLDSKLNDYKEKCEKLVANYTDCTDSELKENIKKRYGRFLKPKRGDVKKK